MAAVELNFDPSSKQLRQFGFIGMCALPLLGWLIAGKPLPATWEAADTQTVGIFAGIGLVLGVLAIVQPNLLKWVFVAASVITFPIGFVLGEIVMFTIYLIAFAPMALLFRVIGRDALQRNIQRNTDSYWQDKEQPRGAASYYRQS